jgi:uncharacterized protein YjbI with pentapeptide repeats
MADQSHLDIIAQGVKAWNSWRKRILSIEPDLSGTDLSGADLADRVEAWNSWRERNLPLEPDLSGADLSEVNLSRAILSGADLSGAILSDADLSGADLSGVNFSGANLSGADLSQADLPGANLSRVIFHGANLSKADLSEADLSGAILYGRTYGPGIIQEPNLSGVNLSGADLSGVNFSTANLSGKDLSRANLRGARLTGANLREADLPDANLSRADLSDAKLSGADLSNAHLRRGALVNTDLTGATLTGCSIYGISAWNLKLEGAIQQNLNVSDYGEPAVMVDNLKVAQFVYLLLNNEKIRNVLDTIGAKGVLILGRFTEERKAVLDVIRDRLRELGFVPMMFDFARPTQQDFDETIKTLAGLSRFIIADITNPKSAPLELQATMPDYMVPFVPIIQEDEEPFAMFQGLQHKSREWVLDVLKYDSATNLLRVLEEAVVRPALEKSNQLIHKKTEAIRTRHIKDYL